jgi:putative oxidoreductase
MTDTETNRAIALFAVRIITGILFFYQAYDKIFKVGLSNVTETFRNSLSGTFFGSGLLTIMTYLSSYAELCGGLLIITGLGRDYVLYMLAADMIAVAFIFSMIKAMWDMQLYFPRLILILIMLICPSEWDKYILG